MPRQRAAATMRPPAYDDATMERTVDHDLDRVRQDLLRMGSEVEEMAAEAVRTLVERDSDAAARLHARDRAVDDLEKQIDERCYLIMARQQPTAGDLRFLIAATRIIHELERVGDSTKNIAESVLELNQEPPLDPVADIPRMAEIARAMLRDALDAFTNKDSRLALEVCRRDNEVDDLWKLIFRELTSLMVEDPPTATRALHVLFVGHNLERIADHATNIAEDVVYYLEARDIRHTPEGTGAASG